MASTGGDQGFRRRSQVRTRLARVLDGDEVLAHNLELAIYNHTIDLAQHDRINLTWQCEGFCSRYMNKARSMLYNLGLPANPGLRARVLTGEVEACHLVEMSPQDLFPERWVDVLYQVARLEHNRMAPQPALGAQEGAFACSRCKSRYTTYFQLQTRSADEPMTTFVACLDCGKRWKM